VSEQDHNFHNVIEFRNPDQPWPDNPEIPDFTPDDPFAHEIDEDGWVDDNDFDPPSDEDIDEQDGLMLRRQRLFRWAAQAITVALSKMPEVEKVTAFGAVAQPLTREVPRFRQFRRRGIPLVHECADLVLAVGQQTGQLERAQANNVARAVHCARHSRRRGGAPSGRCAHLRCGVRGIPRKVVHLWAVP
jgi:hypothetical protein